MPIYQFMISIVVPVYNVENFLDECIQSILCQTYQNFELVLVDDGSTDDSLTICNRYVSKDVRVKCISIKNNGANNARKVGVANAKGEYIMFVDADDTIANNALENFVSLVEHNSCVDIVIAHMQEEKKEISGYHYLLDLLHFSCWVSMCFKLYRTSILKDSLIDIPSELKYGEDLLQNVNIARFANKVMYCNIEYYNYRLVHTSVTHTMQFSQSYESKFQEFLVRCLFKQSLKDKLESGVKSDLDFAWCRCYLNGLKNVALYSSSFNFEDSAFIKLKSNLRQNKSELNVDEKILLYSNPLWCILLLKSYINYCRFKKYIKIKMIKVGIYNKYR